MKTRALQIFVLNLLLYSFSKWSSPFPKFKIILFLWWFPKIYHLLRLIRAVKLNTVKPHYIISGLFFLWIHLFRIISNPQMSACGIFVFIHGHTQNTKYFFLFLSYTNILSWGATRQCFVLLFQLLYYTVNKCFCFFNLFMSCFSNLYDFSVWFHCLKWPPRMVLKGSLILINIRRLCSAFKQENTF